MPNFVDVRVINIAVDLEDRTLTMEVILIDEDGEEYKSPKKAVFFAKTAFPISEDPDTGDPRDPPNNWWLLKYADRVALRKVLLNDRIADIKERLGI
jgi:hypothetical protein